MPNLNYIKQGGQLYYPVDQDARKSIARVSARMGEVEEIVEGIDASGVATNWNQLIDRPFYEISTGTENVLYNKVANWTDNELSVPINAQCDIATCSYKLYIGDKQYNVIDNTLNSFTGYDVSIYADMLHITYTGTGSAPQHLIKLVETVETHILKKLDRKFIDMNKTYKKFAFPEKVASNETSEKIVPGIWEVVKNKSEIYLTTTSGENFGILTPRSFTASRITFSCYFYQSKSEKMPLRAYEIVIKDTDAVTFSAYNTYNENSNVSSAFSISIQGLLYPDFDIIIEE